MLLFVTTVSFFIVNLAPNSLINAGELNPNISSQDIENLKKIYNLDKPVIYRYFDWLGAIARFDFGISFSSGKPVIDEISDRIGITLFINLTSMFLIFIISLYLGVISAIKAQSTKDNLIKNLSLISFSLPSFYLAILLIIFLAVYVKVFPISGLHSIDVKSGFWYYLDMGYHLVLPIFIMVFGGIGYMILYIRSISIDILKSDYIFYAKTRNFSDKKILKEYIIPNLYPPIITMLGLSLPAILGGSVIIESIFGINGMGLLFFNSALSRDYPVIMGILLISSFLTLLGNILADLVLLKLNPFQKE